MKITRVSQILSFVIVCSFFSVTTLNGQTAFAVGGSTNSTGTYGKIVKTIDGGLTWSLLENFQQDFLYTIHFVNPLIGYAAGYNGLIIKTTDGGENWIVQNDSLPNYIISDIHFYDENIGGAVGGSGLLLTTSDGGATWEQRDLGISYYISFIRYVDQATAYVGTDIYSGAIYKTSDGGESWAIDPTFQPAQYRVGEFVSATTGFIYGFSPDNNGANRYLYKSTDNGLTWTESEIQNSEVGTINNIEFVNDTLGYFANYSIWNDRLYRTTNGGIDWEVDLSAPRALFDYKFFNPQSGIAFKPESTPVKNRFYYTTDGGYTWAEGNVPDNSLYVRDLFVLLETPQPPELFSPAEDALLSTNSLDFHWAKIYKPRHYHLQISRDIEFTDIVFEHQGLASQISPENLQLSAGRYYWRVQATNHGAIRSDWSASKSFRIDGPSSISDSQHLPKEFALYANYPNPFNPATTIRFDVKENVRVKLTAYNNLGQQVAILLNDIRTPGQYSLDWQANQLPSGIYFLRMEAGAFQASQKMTLLK